MGLSSDLEVIFFASSRGRRVLSWLFLLSIVTDADILLSPMLIRWGWTHPMAWTHGVHLLAVISEVVLMTSATIFWLLMLCACTFDPARPMGVKLIWALVFLLATWFGAQFFYLFPFRRSIRRLEQPG
jgi:hypothetical protein